MQNQSNWQRYLVALAEMNFDISQSVFKAFVGEVFHDSSIELDLNLRSCAAILKCTNIFALDKFSNLVENRDELKRDAFLTEVQFNGVSSIELGIDEDHCLQGYSYGYSEVSRCNSSIKVFIELSREDDTASNGNFLSITAAQVKVEDLTSNAYLKGVLGSDFLDDGFFFPIAYLKAMRAKVMGRE
ncbi:hypothetical protein N9B60_04385 [Mariniblastus sp.]|nr:hypothetical protein [Mariniblastus sp.]